MNAAELLASVEAAKQAVIDRIAELRGQRTAIDEELAALGAKRVRKPGKKGPGRPKGSRNQPKLVPEA